MHEKFQNNCIHTLWPFNGFVYTKVIAFFCFLFFFSLFSFCLKARFPYRLPNEAWPCKILLFFYCFSFYIGCWMLDVMLLFNVKIIIFIIFIIIIHDYIMIHKNYVTLKFIVIAGCFSVCLPVSGSYIAAAYLLIKVKKTTTTKKKKIKKKLKVFYFFFFFCFS